MNTFNFKNAATLNAACVSAHQDCYHETRRELRGCIRSRGRKVYAIDLNGHIIPKYESEGVDWTGTAAQFMELRELANTGTVSMIGISCGYDYADSVRGFEDGCYDPFVAEWDVVVFGESD